MTYGDSDRPDLTGTEAREAAKERARELRDQHKRTERRRRLIVQLSVLGGSLVILAIVGVTLFTMNQTSTRGPLNMASDGITITEGLVAERTAGLKSGSAPVPAPLNTDGVIDIRLYVDYMCPNCGEFERKNSEQLRQWVSSGAATLEIHPIALLTNKSAGTQYSLRAANAAACVAEYSPDSFFEFHEALLMDQPEEGTEGLSDEQILDRAKDAGVGSLAKVTTCVEKKNFAAWVQEATVRALNGPIPNSDVTAITTAPTILVDGKQFQYTKDFDPKELALFVTDAAGAQYRSTSSPTPTPTP